MSEIKQRGDEYFYFSGDYQVKLDENTLRAHLHEKEPWMDRISVLDTRDNMWWQHWRVRHENEHFDKMLEVAHSVGELVLRQGASEITDALFTNQFTPENEEIEKFLDEQA